MKKMFGDVMDKLARKIAGSFQGNPFKSTSDKSEKSKGILTITFQKSKRSKKLPNR